MIIIFGTQYSRHFLGRVADWCGVCGDIRPLGVYRVDERDHVYFVNAGDPRWAGWVAQCETCETWMDTSHERYSAVSKEHAVPLDELVRVTHPRLPEAFAARLALLERARAGTLSDAERAQMIRDSFMLVESSLSRGSTHSTLGLPLMCLLCTGLLGGIAWIVADVLDAGRWRQWLAEGIGVAGFAVAVYLWASDGPRYLRNRIFPVVIKALSGLHPTDADIVRALDELRQAGTAVGRRIRPDAFLKAYAAARSGVGAMRVA